MSNHEYLILNTNKIYLFKSYKIFFKMKTMDDPLNVVMLHVTYYMMLHVTLNVTCCMLPIKH